MKMIELTEDELSRVRAALETMHATDLENGHLGECFATTALLTKFQPASDAAAEMRRQMETPPFIPHPKPVPVHAIGDDLDFPEFLRRT